VVAENTLEMEPVDVKQPTTTTTINKGGMHGINPNFETDVKMTSIMRKLEVLEMSKGAQSSAPELSKQVVLFVSFVTVKTTWLNNAPGCQLSCGISKCTQYISQAQPQ